MDKGTGEQMDKEKQGDQGEPKGRRGGGERVFSHGKQSFLSRKCISCGAISLPSCNGFNGDVIFGWVNDVIGPVICIFCTFFKP